MEEYIQAEPKGLAQEEDIWAEPKGLTREDQIFLTFASIFLAALIVMLMFLIKITMALFGLSVDEASLGIGFKEAFISSVFISFFFMIVFAVIAGDGFIGELGLMIACFFVMLVFFTISIAYIF